MVVLYNKIIVSFVVSNINSYEMPTCYVQNCKSRTGHGKGQSAIKMYYFPNEPTLRRQWLEACQRTENNEKLSRRKYLYFIIMCYKVLEFNNY